MGKINVCVIFGGESSEHDVSLVSAGTVISNLDDNKYNIIMCGITKDGKWYYYFGKKELISTGEWENPELIQPAFFSCNKEKRGLVVLQNEKFKIMTVDVVIPVLHGKNGEDGTVQGLLELSGIPYVGCGLASSAVSMDKSLTKILVNSVGIRQARYILIDRFNIKDIKAIISETDDKLGYPVFVKPCSSGSSLGVAKATNSSELLVAVKSALKYDTRILVENSLMVEK